MPTAVAQKRKTQAPKTTAVVSYKDAKAYAAPVLLSAFLLFLVQPMLAKAILPWFGGVATVWIVATLFFQGMLVFGYGYAYLTTRFLPARGQAVCHVFLLLASLATLPISPWRNWHAGAQGDPSLQILWVLLLSVGLPYFLLSTTGPLIQTWYARAERVAFPYRLFAISNLGSLVALLAYPVAIEPFITTRHQMIAWSALYAAFVLLAMVTAYRYWRSKFDVSIETNPRKESEVSQGKIEYLRWGALAACGSALLITVMNHLCRNVVPIPLLWVLPLATYLLTFILCFDRQGWYRPALLRWILPVALGFMMLGFFDPSVLPKAKIQIVIYLACLFIGCMFCHGELAARKPHSNSLGAYYLMIALGGATAAVAIGLIAPRVSSWEVEFPQTLVICALLALISLYRDSSIRRAISIALLIALGLFTTGLIRSDKSGVILQARSFYGTMTVFEDHGMIHGQPVSRRELQHGWIKHGTEFFGQQLETVPTTYYSPRSGVGLLLSAPGDARNIGVVGLGSGTLAAYGRPSDTFTFYEIDPLVEKIARKEFSYLQKCQAPVKVVIGDGRLSIEKEPANKFDVLVIDAFSGDTIPAHLLTRETFDMYFSKLRARGVVAVHITNLFVNLGPLLAALADDMHKQAVVVTNMQNETLGAVAAAWVLVTDDASTLPPLPKNGTRMLTRRSQNIDAWTDDYSNIFQLLR